ncbi:MAG: TIR domain-containing protein [bacterium]|nr:TIR domain-containing protein [bacterium]
MSFEIDLFISYAHIDNLPLKEGDKGWVERFHKALEIRLSQLIGERPVIWRDKKLQGNDFFGDEIVEQFPNTGLMLSIISPRYIKSDWCTKEVTEFHQVIHKTSGSKVGNKSRIFKIIKTMVPFDDHPPEISDTLGYEFFVADSDTGKIRELSDTGHTDLERLYWAKLDDIAHDIRDILFQLRESPGSASTPISADASPELTVYLAETISDLQKQRDMIKRQLQEYGYRVLPDAPLPYVVSKFMETVNGYLEESVLSLHLVGGSYGFIPEGSKESIIELQNHLAAEKSKTGTLQRLIWLLAENDDEGAKEKDFVLRLRTSEDVQYGADLFETSIEEFKEAMLEKLDTIACDSDSGTPHYQSFSTVYLAETDSELNEGREKIKSRLEAQGCKVLPEDRLPLLLFRAEETINSLLEQCDIGIHIMGDHYGVVPEKTNLSLPALQYQLAGQRSLQGTLPRLVRLPDGAIEHDERQRLFLDSVRETAPDDPHTEIVDFGDDDLITSLFAKLDAFEESRFIAEASAPAASQSPAPNDGETPAMVYLICDQQDMEEDSDHLRNLEDYLYDQGYEVVLPIFDGEEEDVLNDYHENLKNCDGVMIYYGAGNELWLRSVTRDLTKIAGYGRTRPLNSKAVYIAPPTSRQKERFRSRNLLVINGLAGFSANLLEPFHQTLT